MSGETQRLRWPWLLAIFLIAWIPRWVTVGQYERLHPMAEHPVIDEASYDSWAEELAGGDWLGEEVFFQEPLYPYSLGVVYSVVGHKPQVARRLQVVLGALTAVGVALLGAVLFGRMAGILAGIAMGLYQPAWLFAALLLKPSAVLFVLTALALSLLWTRSSPRWWSWFLVGGIAGVGALLRGNILVMLPFLCAWPVARSLLSALRKRGVTPQESVSASLSTALRASLLIALGTACALAPVLIRNSVVGGGFVLTTSGAGTNLYGGNNAANLHGVATEFDWVRGIPEHEAGDWRREAERRSGQELSPEQVSQFWMGEVFDSIQRDPGLHLRILFNKLRLALNAHEVADNHNLDWDARYLPLLRRLPLGFGLWGMLGLAGLFAWLLPKRLGGGLPVLDGGAARDARWELSLLQLLYLGTIVLTVMSMRIRLALVPLLLPFAGAWISSVLRRGLVLPQRLALLAGLLFSALVVHLPVFDESIRASELDERDFNLAIQQMEQGQLDVALESARNLGARHPGTQRIETLLAQIALLEFRREHRLQGLSQPDREASLQLERAYARVRNPHDSRREDFRAHAIAAWIAVERGLPATAREHFREAREYDPADFDLALGELRAQLQLESNASKVAAPSPETRRSLATLLERKGLAGAARARATILLAEVDFAIGAAELHLLAQSQEESVANGAPPPTSADEKQALASRRDAAQARIRSALVRLRELSAGLENSAEESTDSVVAARLTVARFQLDPLLRGWVAAANHARRAGQLGGGSEARWLLARALARDGASGASASELAEARSLLRELARAAPESAAAALLSQIEVKE